MALGGNSITETMGPWRNQKSNRSAMTNEHKAALAKGREEGLAVRRYLEALESPRPRRGRQADPGVDQQEADRHRRPAGDGRPADPAPSPPGAEGPRKPSWPGPTTARTWRSWRSRFVKVAKSYGERKGISYSTWRAAGVERRGLQRAGIARTRADPRAGRSTDGSAGPGRRAIRRPARRAERARPQQHHPVGRARAGRRTPARDGA